MIAKDKGRDPRIPDKQNFRIGEVADIAEVESYVLRFWETEFKCLRPSKSKSNQRMYSHEDVELVLQIRDLLYEEGFTIEGARKQLREKTTSDPVVPARTQAVLRQLRKEVRELLQLVTE
jgi:DNA-binding transcriptional MerR regulator